MKLTRYPLLQFNYINNNEGIFNEISLHNKSFLTTANNIIFQPIKNNINTSCSKIVNTKHKGFLSEIIFHGFNYTAKRIKLFRGQCLIDAHKSEIYVYNESITNSVKSRIYKRRLVFFSYNFELLNKIQKAIKELKTPDSYTGKGFFESKDPYIIKKRQKRK